MEKKDEYPTTSENLLMEESCLILRHPVTHARIIYKIDDKVFTPPTKKELRKLRIKFYGTIVLRVLLFIVVLLIVISLCVLGSVLLADTIFYGPMLILTLLAGFMMPIVFVMIVDP